MTPQVSNRQALLDGALLCIAKRGPEVTTREIAEMAGANVSSIAYHFGSKDELIAQALTEGFRRWLADFMVEAARAPAAQPKMRLRYALETLGERLARQTDLARAFLAALSHALHHDELRRSLADALQEMRIALAAFLDLDRDGFGELRASLLIGAFEGLLIQWLIDPDQERKALQQLPELLNTVPDEVFTPSKRH